jgi:hypothetical protein
LEVQIVQLVDNLPFPPPPSAALAATLATLTAAMTQPETQHRPNTFGDKSCVQRGSPNADAPLKQQVSE